MPHLHFDHGIHLHGHGQGGDGGASWFNLGTLAAFLAWFGGTGYLLDHYYGVWFVVALLVATLSGLGGASVVFWFLAKVLMKHEEALDPADYDMVGVLGKLNMPIRAGGIGELVYAQGGTRRVSGARAAEPVNDNRLVRPRLAEQLGEHHHQKHQRQNHQRRDHKYLVFHNLHFSC